MVAKKDKLRSTQLVAMRHVWRHPPEADERPTKIGFPPTPMKIAERKQARQLLQEEGRGKFLDRMQRMEREYQQELKEQRKERRAMAALEPKVDGRRKVEEEKPAEAPPEPVEELIEQLLQKALEGSK